jgi:hypothetical protein
MENPKLAGLFAWATNTDCALLSHLYFCRKPGTGMDRDATGAMGGWRRFAVGVLVFALVLQGIAPTPAGARLAADPATNTAGFELCRHDSATPPKGAPESPAADSHCVFCLAVAFCLHAPVTASQFRTITFAVLSWSFSAWCLPAATVNAGARPRGPPLTA